MRSTKHPTIDSSYLQYLGDITRISSNVTVSSDVFESGLGMYCWHTLLVGKSILPIYTKISLIYVFFLSTEIYSIILCSITFLKRGEKVTFSEFFFSFCLKSLAVWSWTASNIYSYKPYQANDLCIMIFTFICYSIYEVKMFFFF